MTVWGIAPVGTPTGSKKGTVAVAPVGWEKGAVTVEVTVRASRLWWMCCYYYSIFPLDGIWSPTHVHMDVVVDSITLCPPRFITHRTNPYVFYWPLRIRAMPPWR